MRASVVLGPLLGEPQETGVGGGECIIPAERKWEVKKRFQNNPRKNQRTVMSCVAVNIVERREAMINTPKNSK